MGKVSKNGKSFLFFKKFRGPISSVERRLLVDFGVFQENSNDVDEGNYAEDEEPFVLVRSLSTSASEVNPKHIHDEDHCAFSICCSGKSEDIPKHEWGNKNPFNISATVERGESSGNFFDPHSSSSGEHLNTTKIGSNSLKFEVSNFVDTYTV